jgi:hypothetical protein
MSFEDSEEPAGIEEALENGAERVDDRDHSFSNSKTSEGVP